VGALLLLLLLLMNSKVWVCIVHPRILQSGQLWEPGARARAYACLWLEVDALLLLLLPQLLLSYGKTVQK
jgi:hypothetical protein